MITSSKLMWMRQRLNAVANPSPEWWEYLKRQHISLHDVLPMCGTLSVALCKAFETVDRQFVFEFDAGGIPCVVIEALLIGQVDGVRDYVTADLVAWPIGAPDFFATAMGPGHGAALLGPVDAFRLPRDSSPILLHRTPEAWLTARCEGSVILKPEAAHWLSMSNVPLICADREHALEIRKSLGAPAKSRKLYFPEPKRLAA